MANQAASKLKLPGMDERTPPAHCPVCGEGKALSKLCVVDGFDIQRCATCSAEFALPVPDAKTLKAYYDRREWFEGGERGGYQNYDDQTQWSITWVKDILKSTGGSEQKSVLDIGCGYGTHLQLAADLGWTCFGVEPSNHARQIAAERLGGRAYIVETTAELIPHEFELVLILDTIEHLPSPYELIYSLFSIGAITPKTRIVISTPNAASAEAQRDPAAWPYRHPPSHLVYYTPKSLQHLLSRLHFTSIDIRGTAGTTSNDLSAEAGLLVTASGSDFTEFMRERYVPGTWSKIAEYEHVPRYTIALSVVKDKAVLDFGCGTGYGAALLAQAAKSVVGLDIDAAAIRWAKETHRRDALTYLCQGDLGASLPAASFDVITCFEMIEHVDHETQKAVIASFARLLRPDGIMLISTPNPEVTKLYGANPYHLREMDEGQLADLLRPHFPSLQILQQHVRASVSFEDGATPDALKPTFFSNSQTPTAGEPLAFIGICSPAKSLAALPGSVLFDQDVDYIAAFMATQNTLNRARLEKYQFAETATNYRSQAVANSAELTAYKTQTTVFKDQIAKLTDQITSQTAAYEAQSASFQAQISAYKKQSDAFVQQLHDQSEAHLAQTAEYERQNSALQLQVQERDEKIQERDEKIQERDELITAAERRELALANNLKDVREQALQHAVQRDDARMAYHHLYTRRIEEHSSPRFLIRQTFLAIWQRIASRWTKFFALPDKNAQAKETLQSIENLMTLPPTMATTQQPLICSLVIPTKNGGDLFKQVVAGLQRQTIWPNVEFIIVDSGSTDDTIETARIAGAKCIAIPPAEFNHGATRDYAISLTSCERVVLTVQDAIPHDQFMIERLLSALDDDNVAGAYARQIPQPDADPITTRNLNNWLTGRSEPAVSKVENQEAFNAMTPMDRYLASNFDNVCSVIRKSVWSADHFGRVNFGEDIDWGRRALLRGHKIAYEPRAAVIHSHDRPIWYEYKRTYVCHRKLYELFGLQTVPSLRRAFRGWLAVLANDCLCVVKSNERRITKLNLLLKLPALTALQILGQYQGAKDFIAGTQKKITGV